MEAEHTCPVDEQPLVLPALALSISMISATELRDRFEFFVLRRECSPHSEPEEIAAYWAAVAALDDLLAGRM